MDWARILQALAFYASTVAATALGTVMTMPGQPRLVSRAVWIWVLLAVIFAGGWFTFLPTRQVSGQQDAVTGTAPEGFPRQWNKRATVFGGHLHDTAHRIFYGRR